ncbi:MAG: NAD-dependent epimerase/dehydratase family protein, partial [Nocardioidaceae bacterium]
MRILFVGGTRFVGRAMADCALGRGHDVTLLHRGTAQTSGLDSAEHLYADRNGDLSVLDEREFDATIDTSAYVPRQVTSLAKALGDRGGHHIFVSTISVYTSTGEPGVDESGDLEKLVNPTTEEVTGETYGALKALCEEEAREAYGKDAVAVVRPTFVAGPHDHTGRFTWWIRRIAHGGEVLAPGPPDAPTQIIDARDQA